MATTKRLLCYSWSSGPSWCCARAQPELSAPRHGGTATTQLCAAPALTDQAGKQVLELLLKRHVVNKPEFTTRDHVVDSTEQFVSIINLSFLS